MTDRPLRLVAGALLFLSVPCCDAFAFPSPPPSWSHALEHLFSPPLQVTPLEELANVRIPGSSGSGPEILAFHARPKDSPGGVPKHSIILIHEFFGLNSPIVEKAQGLADDLGCDVVAPDTFRGEVTDFIPKAIWLALTTPQDRVNDDLDAVCAYLENEGGRGDRGKDGKLAVMGFCYGGGKAIRYTSQRQPEAATVVFYGAPLTEVEELRRLEGPVCGVFGSRDAQFPRALLDRFQEALDEAGCDSDVRIYEGVGHAFWSSMAQVRNGEQPQAEAYGQCTSFLRKFFDGK